MPSNSKTLIFVNQTELGGHSDDFKDAIQKALNKNEYSVFHELPKKPESIFDAIIDEILLSKVVLLDGTPIHEKTSPDFLIQYGICYPLNKKCFFLVVDKNSAAANIYSKSQIIEGVIHFEYYLDLAKELNTQIKNAISDNKRSYKDESTKKAVHSFEVFGVDQHKNLALYQEINNFPIGTDWKPRFHSNVGSFSALQDLARSIGARSFNIFCLDAENAENMYIGIGIAIGMGRPFLVIKHKDIQLPQPLIGYSGILEYDSFTQLRDHLKQYTEDFLSDRILEWKGSTYYSILSRLEMQINEYSADELERAENIVNAVNSALGSVLAKSYALLGDIYREKNRKISPSDTTLLLKAKEFYEQALRIQKNYKRCEDALAVIEKHIELIDLLVNHRYSSFPRLLALIGEELVSRNYSYVREYLISEVKKLIQNKEYVDAIALLAAMQVHDPSSEEIQILIKQVLENTPDVAIEVIQKWQDYIVELENEKLGFMSDAIEKENHINELSLQLNAIKLSNTRSETKTLEVEKERDELKSKLESIYAQFLTVQKTKEKLEKPITDDSLKKKIKSARSLSGRGVVVNFGESAWGIYKALSSQPYVLRDGHTLSTSEGFVLIDGDKIRDDNGNGENFLSSDALVFEPNSEAYQRILYLMNLINEKKD